MDERIVNAEQWYDKNKLLYEQFSEEVEEIIIKILNTQGVPYQSVSHRVKEKDSYLKKCNKEKYANPIEEITDVFGIRVIAYTNRDVLRTCEILKKEFLIDEKRSIDKATVLETDKVGYRSVHYILQLNGNRTKLAEYAAFKGLKCEVQVRTLLQHAWAEIEHDRNYKFAGVLPDDIKRRFHLVAGVLEMMDSEFDRLSEDIDKYSKQAAEAMKKGDYNLPIDSKSLEQYGLKKLAGILCVRPHNDGIMISEEVVQELISFGYNTIQDIENALKNYMNVFSESTSTTLDGIFRDLMILEDCEKYFIQAYKREWDYIHKSDIDFYKKNGVSDIEKYIEQYDIYIDYENEG